MGDVQVGLNFIEKGSSLDAIKKELKEISKIASTQVRLGMFDKKEMSSLNKEYTSLWSEISKLEEKNQKRTSAILKAQWQERVKNEDSVNAYIKNKQEELTRFLEQQNQKRIALNREATRTQEELYKKLENTMSNMAMYGSVFSVAEFKSLLSLEKQVFDLGVVANKSSADLGALRNELISMSQELPFTSAEIGKAINDVARTGKSVEESFAIVRESAKMATASGEDLASSVKVITKILTAFNLDIRGNADVLDKLHAIASNTPLSFDSLGDAMKNSAGAKTMVPIIVILCKKCV